MLRHLIEIWQRNHGLWLLAAASSAFLIASLAWYQQWQLDLSIANDNNRPIMAQTIPQQNCILVVQIEAPSKFATETGLILLYRAHVGQEQKPAYQQTYLLDPSGKTTVFMVLPPGQYIAATFLDLNHNGQLDFTDADPTQPSEPFASPLLGDTPASDTTQPDNSIFLSPQNPILCQFQFKE
jgi:hypothetical protein